MKKKLLIAEDEKIIRLLIKKALGDRFDFEEAENGRAALAKAQSNEFDCVITDVKMPGMDGLELLTSLRRIKPEAKVIVMTGSGPELLLSAKAGGAYSTLEKPFGINELMATVSGI